MSFNSLESSLEQGQPVYLYRFSLGANIWRYTSADGNRVIAGNTWTAVPIADDGVKLTGDAAVDILTISTTTKLPMIQLFQQHPPAEAVQVAIFRTHEELDDPPLAIFIGEITQVNIGTVGEAKVLCGTLSSSMDREGLRLAWQKTCPYALYDEVTCQVPKAMFAVDGEADSISGTLVNVIGIAGYPDGFFAGGLVEWVDVLRGVERRMIEAHIGATIQIFGSTFNMTPGMLFTLYPGCARTVDACSQFNNTDNYGGAPSMQGYSPFDGNPVFH